MADLNWFAIIFFASCTISAIVIGLTNNPISRYLMKDDIKKGEPS